MDGGHYQSLDLDGEGVSGVLTEQAEGWFYKRNLSPITVKRENGKQTVVARFAPVELVARKPSLAGVSAGRQQFLDLAGDGRIDLVQFSQPLSGYYERTQEENWSRFVPFESVPTLDWGDPNLKFVDLTGDGHADLLVAEAETFTWYRSLGEEGFGPAESVHQALDEEKGPRLIFADETESVYLADLSGDGLTDLVRIRNGEVCYWPNLGYGRFGAKVTMDHAPHFDHPDQFDHKRIRLADIDGSGTTDIIYLGRHQIDIYRNQAGNRWSKVESLTSYPQVDNISSVQAVDLLGNGTACLVWSSPLPGDARRPMRYIALMGEQKPHLLTNTVNSLGAETVVRYAPSTKFYLADKLAGKPWITKLPFPVHVVERVETYDYISRNRFVTSYKYHHGYFDGEEREFRGFGMVEQRDTEEFAALSANDTFPTATNIDETSHVPPVLTKTWFHTGTYPEGGPISRYFEDEYYHEGDESEGISGLTDEQLDAMLLDDTVLPTTLKRQDGSSVPWDLAPEEIREACRALKGSILRQEIYALDEADEQDRPYSASERNYTIELLQSRGENNHAVFFTHPREMVDFHYERKLFEVAGKKLADPRVTHAMTLEVDGFGNVLKSVTIGYGRRHDDPSPLLTAEDREKQKRTLVAYTENRYTNAVEEPDAYRAPLPCEARTYELIELPKLVPNSNEPDVTNLFRFDEMLSKTQSASDGQHDLLYENIKATGATANHSYRRLIEHVRALYRRDDLADLLPLGQLESLALPGESYKLAFTPGLLAQVYQRRRNGQPPENLLPNPANGLGGQGADRGGYLVSQGLKATGAFPNTDPDDHWWIPAGRVFHSPNTGDNAAQELAHARQHFFLPQRYRDPFGQTAAVTYDAYDLLMAETRDPLGNRVTVGERDAAGNVTRAGNDYRVLQPRLVTDPNRNRTEVVFDTLGMVAGTAVKGKDDTVGDTLSGFEPDLTQAQVDGFCDVADPHVPAPSLLKGATTRIIYDLDRFRRTRQAHPEDPTQWLPVYAATLARETHVSDPLPPQGLKIQISFSYSDGFGHEIQKKIQAEPVVGGGSDVNPRWVGSGWTIFNNKGKPVRQYEPFFSKLPEKRHRFEFGVQVGVSPVLFYDPVERVVATLHPNDTYEKVVFDPWQQKTYDVNDTVAANGTETGDPRTDKDIR